MRYSLRPLVATNPSFSCSSYPNVNVSSFAPSIIPPSPPIGCLMAIVGVDMMHLWITMPSHLIGHSSHSHTRTVIIIIILIIIMMMISLSYVECSECVVADHIHISLTPPI